MNEHNPRARGLQTLIQDFIQQRLSDKLDKLADDDPKRAELRAQYRPQAWLADAARRAGQLQLVTHPVKASHPDARGSSLFVTPESLPPRPEAGSHHLASAASDVVGNAAALDVYKFLKLEHEGQTLLALLRAGDRDLLAALSDDAEQAAAWRDAFCAIAEPSGGPASHTRAKQIYWPVPPESGLPANAHDDSHYHLLAPLYSSSLSHWLYQRIQQDRFGEEAKAARQARRDRVDHPRGYSDYPLLAEEKKGGTKPQNISQLNSERKGSSYLLASLPPLWDNSDLRPLYRLDSVFSRFGRRKAVRETIRELKQWLAKLNPEATPPDQAKPGNRHVRNRRDAYLEQIFEELLQFGAAYANQLPRGWTADAECRLPLEEQCWLDPRRADSDESFNQHFQFQDWPWQLTASFARWLNGQLGSDKLQLAEAEFHYWRRELAHDIDWQRQQDNKLREQNTRLLPAGHNPGGQNAD
ncbi:type I-F CRISPR-associated protein Csy1 [Chromobacterium violaceum]|uniref:type I-F CRISPR-associated protein Csy1 n=1 Tax=Chromobacterium violaceum TaxID=536 RepID=UPI0005D3DFF5|nr:type I-F CRISPR-associated protein Csy1 [Chromobacterium violaceum]KJH67026.1 CRISPR-associated protein Csy1 [Chromobacterium violaceum]